jgi:hypothetical protein
VGFLDRLFGRNRLAVPRDDLIQMYFDYYPGLILLYVDQAYDFTGFDDTLVADLEAWEGDFASAADEYLRFRSKAVEREIVARGRILAERVAAALGSAYAVEYMGEEIRSAGPPDSPAAAAAIATFAAEIRAEREEIMRQVSGGAELGWQPYPPGERG